MFLNVTRRKFGGKTVVIYFKALPMYVSRAGKPLTMFGNVAETGVECC